MRTARTKQTLSATREDYIRAIYLLGHSTPVGVTQIAERLKLSKSTVSERVKDLMQDGLVTADLYSLITLTAAGIRVAEILTYKHRVIEVFLHKTLGIKKESVHKEAELLEHACSDEVIRRLASFLNNPTHDPHGTKITIPPKW